MTVSEFMQANGLKRRATVIKWLESGWVPGAVKSGDEWDIPRLARPPYSRARAKTASAVYVSIIEACNERRGVCAGLYRMPEEEFDSYIACLEKEGLIAVREEAGVKYYYSTPDSMKYVDDRKGLEKLIKKLSPIILPLVQTVVTAAAQGAVTAAVGNQG
ncbi:MAG: hypothetical protein IKP26_05595 [Clostridia bacterium]|nr:hypothetical protein [Clostridia bacterium]